MSTIRLHLRPSALWYAVAAAAAGILGIYLFLLLGPASHSTTPEHPAVPPLVPTGSYQPVTKACFALRPVASMELMRSACAAAR